MRSMRTGTDPSAAVPTLRTDYGVVREFYAAAVSSLTDGLSKLAAVTIVAIVAVDLALEVWATWHYWNTTANDPIFLNVMLLIGGFVAVGAVWAIDASARKSRRARRDDYHPWR